MPHRRRRRSPSFLAKSGKIQEKRLHFRRLSAPSYSSARLPHLLVTTNYRGHSNSPSHNNRHPNPPTIILKPYHLSPHTPSTTPSPPLNHHHAPPHLPDRRLHSHLHRPLRLPPHASALTRPSSIPPPRIRAPARLPLLPYIDISTYSNKLSSSAVAG